MLTHQQGQLALTHILENLLHCTKTNPLHLGLTKHGYLDIHDVIMMDFRNIDILTYTNTDNEMVNVPAPACMLLHILKGYHAYRYDEGNPVGDN